MATTVISAAEVKQAADSGRLAVPCNAVITPLARELAVELGVELTRVSGQVATHASDDLSDRIRTIVMSLFGSGGCDLAGAASKAPQVMLARFGDVTLEPFPYPGPPPDMEVRVADVVTADHGSPVAVGYMSLTKGSFPWTMTYDEVQIILEGELHLGGDAGGKVGKAGDVLFVPNGSQITFGTPSWAKFVYVTFPANWEDQIG